MLTPDEVISLAPISASNVNCDDRDELSCANCPFDDCSVVLAGFPGDFYPKACGCRRVIEAYNIGLITWVNGKWYEVEQ